MRHLATTVALSITLTGCSLYFDDGEDPPPTMDSDAGRAPVPDASVAPLTRCERGEPNDSITTPSRIELGPVHELAICPASDFDFFSFDLEASSILYIEASFDNGGGDGDIDLRLYTADGLMVDLSAGFDDTEVIRRDDLDAGAYILEVYGYMPNISNDYDLVVVAQP